MPRRLRSLAAVAAIAAALLLMATPAQAKDTGAVRIVEVSGWIDPVLVDFLRTQLDDAAADEDALVVLQVNSPGSVVDWSTLAGLLRHVERSPVPVAAWVGPSKASARGGAARLVAATRASALAPSARIGRLDDRPGTGVDQPFGKATARLRDGTVGRTDARRLGVVTDDGPVLGQLIVNLHGQDLGTGTLDVADRVKDGKRFTLQPTSTGFVKLPLGARLMHTVASPPIAYLLFVIGLQVLLFEFFTAGVGVAGLTGAACLLLGSYGFGVLPVRGWAVALLVLSAFGFGVDVQTGVPRVWSGAGTVAAIAGSFLLYRGISLSWLTLLIGLAFTLLMAFTGLPSVVRSRFSTPTVGRTSMIGRTGTAVGSWTADGVVQVGEAKWKARANRATPLTDGEAVTVLAIEGAALVVESVDRPVKQSRMSH